MNMTKHIVVMLSVASSWLHSQTNLYCNRGNLDESKAKGFIHWDNLCGRRTSNQNFVIISQLFCSVIICFYGYENVEDAFCICIYLPKRPWLVIWFRGWQMSNMFVALLFGWYICQLHRLLFGMLLVSWLGGVLESCFISWLHS